MPELIRLTSDDYRDLRKTYTRIEYSYFVKGQEQLLDYNLVRAVVNEHIRTRAEFLKDYNTPGREMYFLKKDGEIKGFLELYFYEVTCDIVEFAVLEKGKGLGSKLFDMAMKIIKERGIRNIHLWCDLAGAQEFWSKKGFKRFYKGGCTFFNLKIK